MPRRSIKRISPPFIFVSAVPASVQLAEVGEHLFHFCYGVSHYKKEIATETGIKIVAQIALPPAPHTLGSKSQAQNAPIKYEKNIKDTNNNKFFFILPTPS